MKIEYTEEAVADLELIYSWLSEDDPMLAGRVIARIRQTAAMFLDFPHLGHDGLVQGTREFRVRGLPYLIVYAVGGETIDIVTVIHSRRHRP